MHHDIGTFCLLSFLISLGKCLLNLLIFFKKQTFGFNYFFCVFCFLFYWFPLFIISCFLLTLCLICLSSSSLLKLEFRLLTWEHFAFLGFPDSSVGKESICNVRDLGSIPGEGKGYPLQYSGLENFMDCIVHGITKNRTQLSDFHYLLLNIRI